MIGVLTFGICYGCLILVASHFTMRQQTKNARIKNHLNTISLQDITVIVPFRNEQERLTPLLESIKKLNQFPANIIFVDDASTDRSALVIASSKLPCAYQVISSNGLGKKAAIQSGIEHAESTYILTWDADISFASTYFDAISTLSSPADMHILPVTMNGNSWRKLFELDVYLINAINLAAAGYDRPIAASGANLLFNRQTYQRVNSLKTHQHIASGDDQFLLADFNKTNKFVVLHSAKVFAVDTPAPSNLREFFQQRLRWIQKTPAVKDKLASKIGFIQLFSTLIFSAFTLFLLINGKFTSFLVLWFLKTLFDALLAYPYFKKIGKLQILPLLPYYELLFPIYCVTMAVAIFTASVKWKNRPL